MATLFGEQKTSEVDGQVGIVNKQITWKISLATRLVYSQKLATEISKICLVLCSSWKSKSLLQRWIARSLQDKVDSVPFERFPSFHNSHEVIVQMPGCRAKIMIFQSNFYVDRLPLKCDAVLRNHIKKATIMFNSIKLKIRMSLSRIDCITPYPRFCDVFSRFRMKKWTPSSVAPKWFRFPRSLAPANFKT